MRAMWDWKDTHSDIIHDLSRFTVDIGIVNLRQVREFLSKYYDLDPCEIAQILREAVKHGLLKPARPLYQHWYAPAKTEGGESDH